MDESQIEKNVREEMERDIFDIENGTTNLEAYRIWKSRPEERREERQLSVCGSCSRLLLGKGKGAQHGGQSVYERQNVADLSRSRGEHGDPQREQEEAERRGGGKSAGRPERGEQEKEGEYDAAHGEERREGRHAPETEINEIVESQAEAG